MLAVRRYSGRTFIIHQQQTAYTEIHTQHLSKLPEFPWPEMLMVIPNNLLLTFFINFIYLLVYEFFLIEGDIHTRAVREVDKKVSLKFVV